MRRFGGSVRTGLVYLAVWAIPGPARGLVVKPPGSLPERVAQADCIVVGKIIGLEKKAITTLPFRTARRKVTYRIALLKIVETIKGDAHQKTLRLGFLAPPRRPAEDNVRPTGPRLGPTVSVGQDGLFYLTRHFREKIFVSPMYWGFLARTSLNFRQEVALTRYVVRHGTDLVSGLQAKDARDRFYAAALLIQGYRTNRGGPGRVEQVGARESRLILNALAAADWDQEGQVTPWNLFSQLGLTKADGWTFPRGARTPQDYHRAARAWLKKHAETYRIRRIVSAAEEKSAPARRQK
jgi:hypothetical protein